MFIIGFLFTLFFFLITILFWGNWVLLVEKFFKISEQQLAELSASFFMYLRIILVFLFLTPALALHWMCKEKNHTIK